MDRWLEQNLIEPARDLLASTVVGEEVTDLDRCQKLCTGIELVFRSEVHRYSSWPPESTTDGMVPGLCLRTGDSTIEMIGMCWIDFGGMKFPLRAVITLSPDRSELAMYTAQIGEVDQATGAPPATASGLDDPAESRSTTVRTPRLSYWSATGQGPSGGRQPLSTTPRLRSSSCRPAEVLA